MKRSAFLMVLLVMSGCQAFNGSNVQGTLQAQSTLYKLEETAIAQSASAQRTEVVATAYAAETHVADVASVNLQLLATVRVAETPVLREVAGSLVLGTPEAAGEGRRWFVKTGVASRVRESDGCVDEADVRIRFSTNEDRIYATVRAFNIEAGTPLSVTWSYNNEIVWQESFNVSYSADQICLWFYIDPATVEFKPGSWTVALFADGFQLEAPMAFSIEDSMSEGQ